MSRPRLPRKYEALDLVPRGAHVAPPADVLQSALCLTDREKSAGAEPVPADLSFMPGIHQHASTLARLRPRFPDPVAPWESCSSTHFRFEGPVLKDFPFLADSKHWIGARKIPQGFRAFYEERKSEWYETSPASTAEEVAAEVRSQIAELVAMGYG